LNSSLNTDTEVTRYEHYHQLPLIVLTRITSAKARREHV